MSHESNNAVLDRLFDPVEKCLTPEVARRLLGIRAPAEVQDRLDELADKSSDGTLSSDERSEYEVSVRAINFIGVLQAKARSVLASNCAD